METLEQANSQLAVYRRYMKEFSGLPGWFWPDSVAIWDSLLSYQTASGKCGNFLEIGVFKGKSAAMAALHCRANEVYVLVDPIIQPQARTTMDILKPDAVFFETDSVDFFRSGLTISNANKFRWIHIDGEHTGMAIANDLNIANSLVNQDGIVVLDDFFNAQYPQITAAAFEWISHHPRQLQLFLVGDNKAYFCRLRAAHDYLSYIKDSLHKDMVLRDRDVTIWKTTTPSDMNAFGITGRFGEHVYIGPDWNAKIIDI
jgi:hypothetical protein